MLGDPWQTGDWLINYGGGFVRRGLVGELLHGLAVDGWQLLWLVALVQVGLVLVLFTSSGILFWRTSASPAWLMLTVSPAFLMFPVLYPFGGLRKELFILATTSNVELPCSGGFGRSSSKVPTWRLDVEQVL